MSVALRRSGDFNTDFLREAGETIAEGYLSAVVATLRELALHPGWGRERRFRDEVLKGMHSMRVKPPYSRHLIFYRYTDTELFAERLMHGMRDIPRRLRQPPGAED